MEDQSQSEGTMDSVDRTKTAFLAFFPSLTGLLCLLHTTFDSTASWSIAWWRRRPSPRAALELLEAKQEPYPQPTPTLQERSVAVVEAEPFLRIDFVISYSENDALLRQWKGLEERSHSSKAVSLLSFDSCSSESSSMKINLCLRYRYHESSPFFQLDMDGFAWKRWAEERSSISKRILYQPTSCNVGAEAPMSLVQLLVE